MSLKKGKGLSWAQMAKKQSGFVKFAPSPSFFFSFKVITKISPPNWSMFAYAEDQYTQTSPRPLAETLSFSLSWNPFRMIAEPFDSCVLAWFQSGFFSVSEQLYFGFIPVSCRHHFCFDLACLEYSWKRKGAPTPNYAIQTYE